MARFKVIARRHRLQRYLVHLAWLEPHQRLIVTVPIPQALDRFIQIVGAPVRIYIDDFHREVRVLCVRRDVKRDFNWPTYFNPFLQGLGRVNQNVRSGFHLALIESAALHGVPGAANITTVRGRRIQRIIVELIRVIGCWSGAAERTVAIERVSLTTTSQEKAYWLRAARRPGIRRLPLVDTHRVVAHLRYLLKNLVVLTFEKVIEPGIGQLVIIQT